MLMWLCKAHTEAWCPGCKQTQAQVQAPFTREQKKRQVYTCFIVDWCVELMSKLQDLFALLRVW